MKIALLLFALICAAGFVCAAEPAATVMVDLGAEIGLVKPMFRLGQTIGHGPKKYGVLPSKDFAKWARHFKKQFPHLEIGGPALCGNEAWGARCHLTDLVRSYAEVPLDVQADGSAFVYMRPLSFALVEF